MSEIQLVKLFGEIDDKYIREAAPKARIGQGQKILTCTVAAAVLLIIVANIFLVAYNNVPFNIKSPGAAPLHFYYNGYIYVDHGIRTNSLPVGAELLGKINNVGNTFSGIDFDGNEDGSIYTDPEDDEVMYFWAENWDMSLAGKEKYIVLFRENIA